MNNSLTILFGGSGSGKTTLERKLIDKFNLKKILSYTTRVPRSQEVNGVDYKFVNSVDKKNDIIASVNIINTEYGILKPDIHVGGDLIISIISPEYVLDIANYFKKNISNKINIIFLNPNEKTRAEWLCNRDGFESAIYRLKHLTKVISSEEFHEQFKNFNILEITNSQTEWRTICKFLEFKQRG